MPNILPYTPKKSAIQTSREATNVTQMVGNLPSDTTELHYHRRSPVTQIDIQALTLYGYIAIIMGFCWFLVEFVSGGLLSIDVAQFLLDPLECQCYQFALGDVILNSMGAGIVTFFVLFVAQVYISAEVETLSISRQPTPQWTQEEKLPRVEVKPIRVEIKRRTSGSSSQWTYPEMPAFLTHERMFGISDYLRAGGVFSKRGLGELMEQGEYSEFRGWMIDNDLASTSDTGKRTWLNESGHTFLMEWNGMDG